MEEKRKRFERGLLTLPKSGRTWVRLFIQYYSQYSGLVKESAILIKHNDYHHVDRRALLIRHPCDVMVSYFLHRKMRTKGTNNFPVFVRSKRGLPVFNQNYTEWSERGSYQAVFRYEDLFVIDTWREMFEFWEIPIVDDALEYAFENTKFDNIRKNLSEIQSFPSSWRYLAAQHGLFNVLEPDHNDYHKFRRGIVGGYVDYMSEEDIEYVLGSFTLGDGLEVYAQDYRRREKYER